MKTSILLALAATASAWSAGEFLQPRQTNWTVGQTVKTSSGPVTGHAAANNSAVSEYLGIPFAQAPVGNLRFAAPVAFNGTAPLNGSSYGFSCPVPQSNSSGYTLAGLQLANVTSVGLATLANLGSRGPFGEDCLSLNVWTKPQTGDSKKAVLVWIYGGGFNSGTSNVAGYNGANIAGQEDVIVVTINYRINILGFPGNPAGPANLGLLDQRLAVEWVRDNIANFGGDPSRITLFGQSAGGASVDLYGYAWASDPIVAGLIPESGNAYSWNLPFPAASAAEAWFNTTQKLGCGNASSDATAVLTCMRSKDYASILASTPTATGAAGILGYFVPSADEKIVFSDVTKRKPANVSLLIGNNHYEAGLFRTEFAAAGTIYSDAYWDDFNLVGFTCPSSARANASTTPTWRYRYFGVFPDTTISSEGGAWHAAEIALLFNTEIPTPPATPEEISIGNYMRGAWAAFAKDPAKGLLNYGWPLYNASQDTLIRLAYNNITGPNLINPRRYDADCPLVAGVSVSSNPADAIPPPDLGANVTPTGSASSMMPNSTSAMASPTSAGGGGSATSSPSPTTKSGAGRLELDLGLWLGVVSVLAVIGMFDLIRSEI